jgi:hypothetical protein
MLWKTALVFLAAMVLIGMVGRALFPDATRRALRRALPKPPVCPACGRYLIGRGNCGCGGRGKG